jgi:di/tricarboxylate transporter
MNPGVFSLILFLVLVGVSYFTSINCGLLSIAGAIIIGRVFGLTDAQIYGGVNVNVLMSLVGMFIYSAVLLSSGALNLFVRKFLNLFRVGPKLWPIICFLFSAAFGSLGGDNMGVTVIPIVTMSIGIACGCDAFPVGLITALGGITAFASPITGGGPALTGIALGAGLTGNNLGVMVWLGTFLMCVVGAAFAYLVFGCWKKKAPEGYREREKEKLPPFTRKQLLAIISLPLFAFSFIVLGWHTGMMVCIFSVLLVGLKVADQKEVLTKTAWGAILLVLGTGLYMGVVKSLGGVDVLANIIENMSNAMTVSSVYSFAGGFLSFFSYALAVPIPSLAPTIVPVTEAFGLGIGAQLATYSALVAGSFVATLSPMSFSGACVIGQWSTLETPNETRRSRTFTTQLLFTVGTLVVISLFIMTGVLYLFV